MGQLCFDFCQIVNLRKEIIVSSLFYDLTRVISFDVEIGFKTIDLNFLKTFHYIYSQKTMAFSDKNLTI